MTIDGLCVVLLLIGLISGLFTGLLMQLIHLASAVAGLLGAGRLAPLLAAPVGDLLGLSALKAQAVSLVAAWLMIYLVFVLTGSFVVQAVRAVTPGLTFFDRFFGALFGLLKGGALVVVLLVATVIAFLPLAERIPGFAAEYAASRAVALTEKALFGPARLHERFLPEAVAAAIDLSRIPPEARDHVLQQDESYRRLLDHPDFKALATDKSLVRAVQAGDIGRLMKEPKFLRLLEDRDFVRGVLRLPSADRPPVSD